MTGYTLEGSLRGLNHGRICGRLRRRHQPWLMRWGVLLAALGLVLCQVAIPALDLLAGIRLPRAASYLPFALFLGCVILLTRWRQRHAMTAVRDAPVRRTAMTYHLAPEGVTVTGELSHAQMKWPAFLDVVDDPEGVLLLTGPMEYLVLPPESFRDAAHRAEVLRQAKGWLEAARAA
ncbi:YcxB family protein [Maliponia aquimaris]|uniref:YcxB-like C-terminal domain-containing protein n=1 Tax=Maliponia aquimaris TaxID=1673631 RepID=A0A238L3D4_9RHOB|nr:YcxB family protein [Maliponia aquimaris]SMX49584.1 hypothetical protein MAA8898_04357 [Maliponia aquimaris]